MVEEEDLSRVFAWAKTNEAGDNLAGAYMEMCGVIGRIGAHLSFTNELEQFYDCRDAIAERIIAHLDGKP